LGPLNNTEALKYTLQTVNVFEHQVHIRPM
jgi:hypothetical protein